MEIPQLVTGPQKCDVFGPVGELINAITRAPIDSGCDGVAVALTLDAAAAVADAASAALETRLVAFSPARSEKVRVTARVAPRVKIDAYMLGGN